MFSLGSSRQRTRLSPGLQTRNDGDFAGLAGRICLHFYEVVVSETDPIYINKGWHELGLAALGSTFGTDVDVLQAYSKRNAFVYYLWDSHRDELDQETLARRIIDLGKHKWRWLRKPEVVCFGAPKTNTEQAKARTIALLRVAETELLDDSVLTFVEQDKT